MDSAARPVEDQSRAQNREATATFLRWCLYRMLDKEGGVGAVTLPGKAPLAELFQDLPFGPDALDSPTALLNALVGSEVEIAGQVAAKGRIFRVETEEVALPNNGGRTSRHRLTLLTEKGLVQALLEEITALRFTDTQTNAIRSPRRRLRARLAAL
jgi:hypothetical protein